MMRLVEPMEARLANLEKQVHETDTRTLTNQLKIASNRQYLDQQLHQMNETLTSLVRRMQIVEEITKTWNRMQQELTTINTEIAAVRESQRALTTLMEGISTQLEAVAEIEPSLEEFGDFDAAQLSKAWDFTGSGVPLRPMERLATILEVARTEAVPTPMMRTFAPPVSLPEIRPQGPPSCSTPSSPTAPS